MNGSGHYINPRDVGKNAHIKHEYKQSDIKRGHKQHSSSYSSSGEVLRKGDLCHSESANDLSEPSPDQRRSHFVQKYNVSGDEDGADSQNELRKKTRELHQILNKRGDLGPMSRKGVEILPASLASKGIEVDTTFSAESGGQRNKDKEKRVKHVVLTPDHRALTGNENSGVEICKKLFGITVFEYSNGNAKWNHMNKDRKLVVQGVIEGSASHNSGRIHRGDMLVRVNDADVSWLNFTRLLSALNKREKVKLTFQSPRIVGPKLTYSVLQVPEADLCFATVGKRLTQIQSELSPFACVTLYLTLVPSSSEREADEKEDIIYAFPPGEENMTALRGLFVTLSSALLDVVSQPATGSHLILGETSVNVVYKQFGRDVLVFAMPEDRISVDALTTMLNAFSSLMVLLFSSVKSAFSDCDRTWLDKILALMFHQALGLHSFLPSTQLLLLPLSSHGNVLTAGDYHLVKVLDVSHENKLICDEILSEYEAMDFDDYMESTDLFSRRQYTVKGTSLFYKDHLLCTHLPAEQQRDVNLFLNFHGLLTLASRRHVDQVMVWQELKSSTVQDATLLPAGFRPSHSRSFIMIVGLNHFYLAVIVESGGCSVSVQGQARPHPLLVEQGKTTLSQLETEEMHMSRCCEDRLTTTTASVTLVSADQLCKVTSPRNRASTRDPGGGAKLSEVASPTKTLSKNPFARSKSVDRIDDRDDAGNAVVMRRQGSKLSYGSNDSAGSGSSTGPPKSRGSRVSSMADLSGITRSLSVLQIDAPHDILRGSRLTRGRSNTLFSYMQFESGEGIIISPTQAELNEVHSTLQQQVLENFCLSCHKMRSFFREKIASKDGEKSVFDVSLPPEESDIREAGTLFQCTFQSNVDKKQQINTLHYWVVGRCWSNPRPQEMFVCFHESTSQAIVEMAFSLGFGA